MKYFLKIYYATAIMFFAILLLSIISFAQDTTLATTTTTTTTTNTEKIWHMEPWAWVLGGVVLLVIILIAIRGSINKTSANKVTITRTEERDTDKV